MRRDLRVLAAAGALLLALTAADAASSSGVNLCYTWPEPDPQLDERRSSRLALSSPVGRWGVGAERSPAPTPTPQQTVMLL